MSIKLEAALAQTFKEKHVKFWRGKSNYGIFEHRVFNFG